MPREKGEETIPFARDQLREWMYKKGITRKDLAKQVFYSEAWVKKILNTRRITPDRLDKIAEALDIEYTYLTGESKIKPASDWTYGLFNNEGRIDSEGYIIEHYGSSFKRKKIDDIYSSLQNYITSRINYTSGMFTDFRHNEKVYLLPSMFNNDLPELSQRITELLIDFAKEKQYPGLKITLIPDVNISDPNHSEHK